ncbi:MAG: hypothetical protein GY775_11665 [Candidatus Scalindua sp.]|nr:hypothetical protein [Candidatus Scalindua sp.]
MDINNNQSESRGEKIETLPYMEIGVPTPIEFMMWTMIGLLASWKFWYQLITFGSQVTFIEIATNNSGVILFSILLVILPFLFYQIFGFMPFNALRRYAHARRIAKKEERSLSLVHIEQNKYESMDVDKLLTLFSLSSERLANNIYRRAGVYLLIGVLIAFSGLVFFYSQTNKNFHSDASSPLGMLMSYGPRFGILFFIEFVAFFFLRQYKSAMDEFRYYEAIKRNREENLALIRFAKEQKEKVDIFDLIMKSKFYSDAGKLAKGETTEILESKKLQKDEIAIFEKIIESVGNIKKN